MMTIKFWHRALENPQEKLEKMMQQRPLEKPLAKLEKMMHRRTLEKPMAKLEKMPIVTIKKKMLL